MLTQDRLVQAPGRFRIFIDGTELFAADLTDCASKPMSTNRLRSSIICGGFWPENIGARRTSCQEQNVDEMFLNEMRERLQARAVELRDTIARIDGTTAPVSPNNAIGRLTRLDAMQATSMRQAAARDHDLELRHVVRALEAMANGKYGICRRCKEDMAELRLRAKPEAFLCLACASNAVHRR